MTVSKLSEILQILTDGRWHMLSEIQEKTNLSECQIDQIVAFLKEYSFVSTADKRKEIRLKQMVWSFLKEEATS